MVPALDKLVPESPELLRHVSEVSGSCWPSLAQPRLLVDDGLRIPIPLMCGLADRLSSFFYHFCLVSTRSGIAVHAAGVPRRSDDPGS